MPRKPETDQPDPLTPPVLDAETLADENAALRAQNDKALDLLVDMQDRVAKLESAGPPVVAAPSMSAQQVASDAELAALKEEFKDFAGIDVAMRRSDHGADASPDIRLKGEPSLGDEGPRVWKVRWFNHAGKEGRSIEAANLGFVKVRQDELQDVDAIGLLSAQDQYVRRGERGHEVLYKMPLKLWDALKKRERLRRQGLVQSESHMRSVVASGVAGMVAKTGGNADRAGMAVDKMFSVTVTPQEPERVHTSQLVGPG